MQHGTRYSPGWALHRVQWKSHFVDKNSYLVEVQVKHVVNDKALPLKFHQITNLKNSFEDIEG